MHDPKNNGLEEAKYQYKRMTRCEKKKIDKMGSFK